VLIDRVQSPTPAAANRYVLEIVRDYLTKTQAVDLALSYRKMRDEFLGDSRIAAITRTLPRRRAWCRRSGFPWPWT